MWCQWQSVEVSHATPYWCDVFHPSLRWACPRIPPWCAYTQSHVQAGTARLQHPSRYTCTEVVYCRPIFPDSCPSVLHMCVHSGLNVAVTSYSLNTQSSYCICRPYSLQCIQPGLWCAIYQPGEATGVGVQTERCWWDNSDPEWRPSRGIRPFIPDRGSPRKLNDRRERGGAQLGDAHNPGAMTDTHIVIRLANTHHAANNRPKRHSDLRRSPVYAMHWGPLPDPRGLQTTARPRREQSCHAVSYV